jgi:DNA-binding Lrp family transcriptional regulator
MPAEPHVIDELDRRIVERLRDDGREPNRSLATALGVGEATIATRLKRLDAAGAMRVVALTDMEGFGFPFLAFALVTVSGRPAAAVGTDLAAIPEVISVTVATGRFDIVACVLARTRSELGELFGVRLPRVAGVERVRCEFAIDVLRYDSEWAALRTAGATPDLLPGPELRADGTLDALDLAIIGALQRDARSSNRKVAAELDVSEGTVRTRLRRLEGEQRVRIRAVCDVEAFGLRAYATVGIQVAGGEVERAGRALREIEGVPALVRSLGEFDFIAILAAESRAAMLQTLFDRVQTAPGVRATEMFEVAGTLKHVFTWVRLIDR